MTNEEALNVARQSLAAFEFVPEAYDNAYTEACAAALEKQIPKKPKRIEHWTMCPVCFEKYGFTYDILVGMTGIRSGACFCLDCGQRIDMTEEKENTMKEEFTEPELEVIDLSAEDVVTASAEDMDDDRPGHGYGDENHNHKHWKDET